MTEVQPGDAVLVRAVYGEPVKERAQHMGLGSRWIGVGGGAATCVERDVIDLRAVQQLIAAAGTLATIRDEGDWTVVPSSLVNALRDALAALPAALRETS